ncbi:WG repeat-containing protein [Alkalimarinus alittae]|uniref:WG repeat-containing protein n=1 Tax=Alkalimarinus alittae TaxID=2961619 RepID=A0ABY6MXN1_9ALTE|nr:WG repeat-containing protein [Alkalimarinus alittae]UZE94589.1 WG repeat-containing protein [Alkalimarinus alittae]
MKIAIFTLLLLSSFSIRANETCAYFAKETIQNKFPEWQSYDNCATYKGRILNVLPNHLSKVAFDVSGLAPFWASGHYFYLKEDGNFLSVIPFDNGADTFREGLVRSVINSKIAYFNQELQMVIPPKYDWGWPFYNGRALVCTGCKISEPDDDGHKPVKGGVWGYINKSGKEVVTVKFNQTEVPD